MIFILQNLMAHIAILGSGFVGEATGKVLSRQGHSVVFVDIDHVKLQKLEQEGYQVSTLEALTLERQIDIFFLAVPTPTQEGEIKLTALEKVATDLGVYLRRIKGYPIIVLKSTVPPGTTRNLLTPRLEASSGKKAGIDFGVAFEPEYLRQETSLQDASTPRLITIGTSLDDAYASKVLGWLRKAFNCPIEYVSLEEAEMQKYVHNLFNATKISFFNEMRMVCRKLGIDEDKIFNITSETAEASWNARYGIRNRGPFDGACLPKDTEGFLHFAKTVLDLPLPLLTAVIHVNKAMEKITGQRRN